MWVVGFAIRSDLFWLWICVCGGGSRWIVSLGLGLWWSFCWTGRLFFWSLSVCWTAKFWLIFCGLWVCWTGKFWLFFLNCGFVFAFVKLLWVLVVVGIVIMILLWIYLGVAVNFLLSLYGDKCEWQWRAEGGGSPWPRWIVEWVAIGLWWSVEDMGDRRGLIVDCQKK